MKPPEFTNEEILSFYSFGAKRIGNGRAYVDYIRAAIQEAFKRRDESEMRPKDAGVMPEWISLKERVPTDADATEDGEVAWLNEGERAILIDFADTTFRGDWTHWISLKHLVNLPHKPIPADPTQEEKAEAEFEAWALQKLPLGKIKEGEHAGEYVNVGTLWAYAAFMAAKFPAGEAGK